MNTNQFANLSNLPAIGPNVPAQPLSLLAGGKVAIQDFHFVMRVNKSSPILG